MQLHIMHSGILPRKIQLVLQSNFAAIAGARVAGLVQYSAISMEPYGAWY